MEVSAGTDHSRRMTNEKKTDVSLLLYRPHNTFHTHVDRVAFFFRSLTDRLHLDINDCISSLYTIDVNSIDG